MCGDTALGSEAAPPTWLHTTDVDVSPVTRGRPEGEPSRTDWRLYFDGGARVLDGVRNGGGGWLLFRPDGLAMNGEAVFFGINHSTNNAAELATVFFALKRVAGLGMVPAGSVLHTYGDSELVIRFLMYLATAKHRHLTTLV